MSKATDDVLAERQRQIEAEGWTAEHDDQEHHQGDLAMAGCCYAAHAAAHAALGIPSGSFQRSHAAHNVISSGWPWAREWWKPKSMRRDLVRAAALLIAEIERLDRAESKTQNVK